MLWSEWESERVTWPEELFLLVVFSLSSLRDSSRFSAVQNATKVILVRMVGR